MSLLHYDKIELENRIEKVIHVLLNMESSVIDDAPIPIMSMKHWEWPQGVALFALYLYYLETSSETILQFLYDWFDDRIDEGLPEKNVNTICPMLTLTFLAEKESKYMRYCEEWIDYVMYEMPRTGENAIQHIVTGHANTGQIWDDTLYMTVLFITRMGILKQSDELIQESIHQFLVHLKYLTDPKTGLFFHAWTFKERHHFANALWARGNSWYTAGLVDYLNMVALPEGVKKTLLAALQRQVETLSLIQAQSGLWHTILDDNTSYEETSATAALGYGILKAIRKNYLDHSFYNIGIKAFEGVLNQIDNEGVVQGVSYGTGVGMDLQDYKDIPQCPMPYGQSMTVLMLVEGLKHLK